MERTKEAINLFKERYGKTPKELGLPVIGIYEKQHAFLYADTEEVIKAYKTHQNIMRWQISWYIWLLVPAMINFCYVLFRYQDVMNWRGLATYVFLGIWIILGIVQWLRAKRLDRLIKQGENITFLNY